MDFVEQIGERYLMGKANAAPQQLENLVKKQFAGGTEKPGGGEKAASAAGAASSEKEVGKGSAEKDAEITKLRAQLAQSKLERKAQASNAGSKKGSTVGKAAKKTQDLEALGTGAGIEMGTGGKKQLEAPKDMKGLKALGAGAAASGSSKARKELESSDRRTSSASRAAKEELPALSGASGKSKAGKQGEGLAGLPGLGAGASTGVSKTTMSEQGRRIETSSIGRSNSVSFPPKEAARIASSHHTEKRQRSKSVKQPSDYGSEAHSTALSRKSYKPASAYGGDSHSIVPLRPPPEYGNSRGVKEYAGAEESRLLVPFDSRRSRAESDAGVGEVYVIEVEEDLPRRRRSSMKERSGGVVEISHNKGRTVYMVK